MSNFFHFLKLIRSSNLFLIALTQILAKIFILKEDLGTNFLLLIIITLCIALSGYIINDVFVDYFKGIYPARSVVEVSRLPKDSKVEIECVSFYEK